MACCRASNDKLAYSLLCSHLHWHTAFFTHNWVGFEFCASNPIPHCRSLRNVRPQSRCGGEMFLGVRSNWAKQVSKMPRERVLCILVLIGVNQLIYKEKAYRHAVELGGIRSACFDRRKSLHLLMPAWLKKVQKRLRCV